MRQSQLATKTRREAPRDEESTNAKLLIRAGFVHKEMAGAYSYLPLGLRVLRKIEAIIREEMNAIGGQEMLMTTLQNPDIWRASGRWAEEKADPHQGLPWLKTELVSGGELGIANTHEEDIANILTHHVHSYKDLPQYLYQIQNKFRNEHRAKSGLMRGREFLMKDMYSFNRTTGELEGFYEKAAAAYLRVFQRVGLGGRTYRTFASGGAFSRFSDEFQTVCDTGEDTIYIDKERNIAVNKEVYTDEVLSELGLKKESLQEAKAVEVGNIFKLGTKYSESAGLLYRDENGKELPVVMGSYGIGLGRLMGTIVEIFNDKDGIQWPSSVAPLQIHLIALQGGEEQAASLERTLEQEGMEVLLDDREDVGAGEKLKDADLIGIPVRCVVSAKTAAANQVEIKKRSEQDAMLVGFNEAAEAVGKLL